MLSPQFVLLAAAINLAGCMSYAKDTLTGRTQPNRVGWSLWAIAPLIAFAAEAAQGVGWASLFTLSAGLGPMLVLLASFVNRKAYWKLKPFDWTCGALSLLALLLWLLTGQGNIAIILSIAADILACLPTLTKAYTHPQTESSTTFAAGVVGGVIVLLTINQWTIQHAAFPIYLLVANGLIAATIIIRGRLTRRYTNEKLSV